MTTNSPAHTVAKTTKVEQLSTIRREIDAALSGIASRYQFELGRCTYSDNGFDFKLEGTFPGGKSREQLAREHYEYLVANSGRVLPPLGATITMPDGKRFQVIGAKPGCKMNVLMKREDDGRVWRFTTWYLAETWAADAAAAKKKQAP
jgi:hypothetical protein